MTLCWSGSAGPLASVALWSAGVAGTLRCTQAAGRAVHPPSRERQRDKAAAAEPAAGACRQAGSPAPCWGLQNAPPLLQDSCVAQQAPSKMLLELADKWSMHMSTASVCTPPLPAAWPVVTAKALKGRGCHGLVVHQAAVHSLALGESSRQALHSLRPSAVLVQARRWCPSCPAGAIAASSMQACDILRAAMPWCWPRTGTRLTLR